MLIEKKEHPEKVLQFGTGNFLRAFADWMIDTMNKQNLFNGSIVIVQSTNNGTANVINEQDGLYTCVLQGISNGKATQEFGVVQSVSRALNIYNEYDEYLLLARSVDLRFIISNTTEAGIIFNENDLLNDQSNNSFPAKLTTFLYHRFLAFNGDKDKGLVIIPCELITQNGDKIKEIVLKYAQIWNLDKDFREWILQANTFCNSLVDRIVPGFPKDQIDEIQEKLGYQDQLIVVGEPYHLWAIEGPEWLKREFPAEQAGLNVKIVKDLEPYRESKVRILNGAHTAMTSVAYLCGIDTVREAVLDRDIKKFLDQLMFKEIIPILHLPKEELNKFADEVLNRFSNPYIHHYLLSISLNAMSKFKARNLTSLLDYVDQFNEIPRALSFSLSAWISFYKGRRFEKSIELVDDEWVLEFFKQQWNRYEGEEMNLRELVVQVLANEQLWDCDLNRIPELTDYVANFLNIIEREGMKVAVQALLLNG
ncbi:altronate oxidoreductase [Pradoshia eiseniae]|uniref:Altronate oxidoreductase n=2 Tax=Pradoshia eiseniae TaxID=2064768 RepID=A0A2S7N1Q8_9BACI|nr:altronate oxidoreductase [Pradoshia eiseniae]